jgi:hypothetical protein
MIYLYESGVDVLKKRASSNNLEIRWDNYDVILWQKNSSGFFNVNGEYRKNNWGISSKFAVNKDGVWILPAKYVKYFK